MKKEYSCIEKWVHDLKPLSEERQNLLLDFIKEGADAYKIFTILAEWNVVSNMQAIVLYCGLLRWDNLEKDDSYIDKYFYSEMLQKLGLKEEDLSRYVFTPDDFMYMTYSTYVQNGAEYSTIQKIPKKDVNFINEIEDVRELSGEMLHYHNKLIDAVDDAIVKFDKIKFIDIPQSEIDACRIEKEMQMEKE